MRDHSHFLVTNWHVVTGRHPDTNQPLSPSGAVDPDSLAVWLYGPDNLGEWHREFIQLRTPNTGAEKWLSHPDGRAVDVVAVPFTLPANRRVFPLDLDSADFDINYQDKPVFLIDATTKPAMSGSPVIARRYGGYRSSQAALNVGGVATRFLGVYSGRIHEDIDANIGFVWKPVAIRQILAAAGAG